MSLQKLPAELLLQIISYLPAVTIERFAKTFNKRLTYLCLPLLKDRLAAKHNAKQMATQFGYEPPPHDAKDAVFRNIADIWSHYRGLKRKWGPLSFPPPFTKRNPFPCLDFLDLRGEFDWLAPIEDLIDENCQPFEHCRNIMSAEDAATLKTQAQQLGLQFPKGFFDFMRTMEEDYHVRSPGGCYFEVPKGGLRKVRYQLPTPRVEGTQDVASGAPPSAPADDTSQPLTPQQPSFVDGYVLRFYADQQGCYYWHLFLAASGAGHCVLGSDSDGDVSSDVDPGEESEAAATLSPLEEALGIRKTKHWHETDWSFEGSGFEEFVARMYFEGMAVLFEPAKGARPPEGLKRYMVGIYSEKGREMGGGIDL
ncbi:hypothetical protein MMC10_003369 [Thelotrema lepadinum]|nr:hypothetical protein [Thelotrema lepadinum]